MSTRDPWWLVAGIGVWALLDAGSRTSTGRQLMSQAKQSIDQGLDWIQQVIQRTIAHEGTYDSLNLNTDGAGLSFGILQWAQLPGALGELLAEMYRTDPARFAACFGPAYPQLLEVTRRGSLEPVSGAVLWAEPWISRFRAAGRDPVFRAVQDRLAARGTYMRAAIDAAQTLGVPTERGLALTFDTAVQQGPQAARQFAVDALQAHGNRPTTMRERLETYKLMAARPYRKTGPPPLHRQHPRLQWLQVGTEWHLFAGRIDLYIDILRRRNAILLDPALSDIPVKLPQA